MPEVGRASAPRGFTLIELVIVILVIGILAVLLTPKYRQSVMKAQGADVATRVETINVALKSYEADHDSLPVGTEPVGVPSWLVPYMGPRDLFAGPSNITWQYSKPLAHERAMLIVTAGPPDDKQILLAAAAALGSIAAVIGGGSSLIISLTE